MKIIGGVSSLLIGIVLLRLCFTDNETYYERTYGRVSNLLVGILGVIYGLALIFDIV